MTFDKGFICWTHALDDEREWVLMRMRLGAHVHFVFFCNQCPTACMASTASTASTAS